ncbi:MULTISPECIES: site-specific DNA-methyltransferase [Salinibacter]|jgi:adenine-specific DNA-methyltransferase|uniref:site-specific DNA-methyltransferase (adenine-specific) n=1 Tax=Salinibacter ruber TaxID=146919 RepID=A0A9X2ZPD1_9BACT|nr:MULTISPECIES: site-specific DNA-methyltransferase [Salinibacter]MCS3856415.1 adenine-specific DNA-methyltransferase [Salinibacter ruber]MCS3859874.1 adenine-specific DNA-methyltransferase [Salinibacter ruber]MCS3866682.1 adenine-specific DNA-methyltransferase [Salinibacter ruber]
MEAEKIRPSYDHRENRLEKLQEVVPEAFSDGELDLNALREVLDAEEVGDEEERFGLFWPGKKEARRVAREPSRGTLVPDSGNGRNADETDNVFIEGDNLEVLKLLQKSYAEQVKLIYIDPPYNTGDDFIYQDDYSDPLDTYLDKLGALDDEGNPLTSNTRSSGRFHSNWLNMIYPRMVLARQLLGEEGCIFVSIDDNELYNYRLLMDEVFGESNFVSTVIWQKVFSPKPSAKHFSVDHDYLLVYAKDAQVWRPNLLPRSEEANSRYKNLDNDPRGRWTSSDLTARNYYEDGQYEVESPSGEMFTPTSGRYWTISKDKFHKLDEENRIWWGEDGNNMPRRKRFLSEVQQGMVPQTFWSYEEVGHTQGAKKELLEHVDFENTANVLNTVKPTDLIKRILHIATDPSEGDIVMDFFAGSATTAHATLQKNAEDGGDRRFVMVQLPEPLPEPEEGLGTLTDIARTRLESVCKDLEEDDEAADVDTGFRACELSRTNFKAWDDYEGDDVGEVQTLFDQYETPLVDGWDREDLLSEVLLMQGYPLDSSVEELDDFDENKVLKVTTDLFDSRLFICLDQEIMDETVKQIELSTEDTFVCLDSALTDESKMRISDAATLKVI